MRLGGEVSKGTFLKRFDIRESAIDRSEWLPYGLAQIERESNPEFALACLTPWLSRILHESLLEGE